MIKEYAKYMRKGKQVKNSSIGNVYKLVEDMQEDKETVKAVNIEHWRRYDLLTAWIQNWEQNSYGFRERFTQNIEDCKIERQSYVEEIKIVDVEPDNIIRFITSDYQAKFETKDLSTVSVNGDIARVMYLDSYHFAFVEKNGTSIYSGCYHICQYAEICERNGIEVKPIIKEDNVIVTL